MVTPVGPRVLQALDVYETTLTSASNHNHGRDHSGTQTILLSRGRQAWVQEEEQAAQVLCKRDCVRVRQGAATTHLMS